MKATVINPVTGKTIDEKTLDRYIMRGEQLLRQFARMKGVDPNDAYWFIPFVKNFSPTEFSSWLTGRRDKGEFNKNAWRQYKQCACLLLHGLMEEGHPNVCPEHLEALKNELSFGAAKAGTQTSANKKKGFDRKEQQTVEAFLKKSIEGDSAGRIPKYQYAPDLYDFIHGNLHVGLRPSEYAFATLRGKILMVRNGKHSNGRAHGEDRELDLSDLPEDVVDSIRRTVTRWQATYFPQWAEKSRELGWQLFCDENPVTDDLDDDLARDKIEGYTVQVRAVDTITLPSYFLLTVEQELERISKEPLDSYYRALSDTMRSVTRRVFAKRTKGPKPTLYSTRHQMTANMKRAGMDKAEIAAIMGQKITRTHQVHYARRSKGEDGIALVRGRERDINRVRYFSDEREMRLAKKRKLFRS